MPRAIWKGSISFGLVNIPVQLHPAVRSNDIDFDWLDKRSMAPIGYKRINKQTGRGVDKQFIVRGYQYEADRYVVLSDEEIQAANPRATQSVDIISFCNLDEVSFLYLETPYYLAPDGKGEKAYILLREALTKSGKIGIANVVIRTKQRLAALIPCDNVLVLNTLRWASELRDSKELSLPKGNGKAPALREKELSMALKLIEEMSEHVDLRKYHENFHADILALVKRKVKTGKSQVAESAEPKTDVASNVIDLTELLKRSLKGVGQPHGPAAKTTVKRTRARKAQATTSEKRRRAS